MVAQSLNRELRFQWGDGVVERVLHGGREVQSVRWEETEVEGGAVVKVVWLWTGVLKGHTGEVNAVASLGDGRVVSGSEDKTVRIWGVNGECERILKGHTGNVYAVASLGDGRVVSGSFDMTVRIWGVNGE